MPFAALVSFLLLGTENIGACIEEPFHVLPLASICRCAACLFTAAAPLLPRLAGGCSAARRPAAAAPTHPRRAIEESVREMGDTQRQWGELLECSLAAWRAPPAPPAPMPAPGALACCDSSMDLSPTGGAAAKHGLATACLLADGFCADRQLLLGLAAGEVAIPAGLAGGGPGSSGAGSSGDSGGGGSSGGGSSGGSTAVDVAADAAAASSTAGNAPHSRSSSFVGSIGRRSSVMAAAALGLLGVAAGCGGGSGSGSGSGGSESGGEGGGPVDDDGAGC